MHLAVVPRVGDTMSLLNVRHCSTDADGILHEWFGDVRGEVTQVVWLNNLPGHEPMASITLGPSPSTHDW